MSSSPEVPGPLLRQHCESTHTGRCMTRYVPPSGFLSLLAVYASQHLVALFHATGTRGVPSLQGFSLSEEPLHVSVAVSLMPVQLAEARRRLQGFAPLEESVDLGRVFTPTNAPIPSWASSPPGFSPSSP